MCGIAASLGASAPVPTMLEALAHRGPDHLGWEGEDGWALGATRLRITGGLGGDMPLRSRSGRVVLAVNGQIFNHRELYPAQAEGSDLSGLADLLEAEGPSALERLRGPFALVAWDRRDERLLLARDEYGVRPLFFREEQGGLRVASEVAALLPETGFDPDAEAWAHLLAFQFWPADRSLHRGVRSLAPGTWLSAVRKDGGLEFDHGRFRCGVEDRGSLKASLGEAFALQAPTDHPTGLCLSGGLDSSAVAGWLVAAGQRPEVAVVGWFPGAPTSFDERPWARAVASELGLRLVEVAITPERYLEAWERTLLHLGGPLAGPGAVSQWILAEALAKEGVRVVFTGQGGDELFGGYERHRLLLQRDAGFSPTPSPGYAPLARAFTERGCEGLLFRGAELLPLLEPEVAARVHEAAQPLRELDAAESAAEALREFEIRTLLPGLLAVDDRAFGAFGIEGRVPLLDPVLARRVRELPLSTLSPPSATRQGFRELCGRHLPRAVSARRDKMGFPIPLASWFAGPWRALLHDHPGVRKLPVLGFQPPTRRALGAGRLHPRTRWFLLSCAIYLASRSR